MTVSGVSPRSDEQADDAATQAAAFIARVDPHHSRLVDAAIYGMADLDCDLAAGDSYDPDNYREAATGALNAVLNYLAWTPEVAALVVVTASGVSPRSNEEVLAQLERQARADDDTDMLWLIERVRALLVEREDQDRRKQVAKAAAEVAAASHVSYAEALAALINADDLRAERDALAAENERLRNGVPRQRKGVNPFLPDAPVRTPFTDEGVFAHIGRWCDGEREKEEWRDGDTNTYRYRANLLEAAKARAEALAADRDELRAKVAAVEALCAEYEAKQIKNANGSVAIPAPFVRAALAAASPGDEEESSEAWSEDGTEELAGASLGEPEETK